jgi:excisionase family DNA binding protein
MEKPAQDDIAAAVKEAIAKAGLGGARLGYRVEEFAAETGIGRTKLYAEIAAGRLRARKVGKRTVILAEDGRAYLASLPVMQAA